jgi:hypothetical protein
MIPGLDQLPSFFPLLTEERFQPAKASPKGIGGNETLPGLIACNPLALPSGRWTGQFMDRYLIFPLDHVLASF